MDDKQEFYAHLLNTIKELEERIIELEAFAEKAMANPMIAGMLE